MLRKTKILAAVMALISSYGLLTAQADTCTAGFDTCIVTLEFVPDDKLNNTIVAYEYWFDWNFVGRSYVETVEEANWTLNGTIDASTLVNGFHSMGYRFQDDYGEWSVPYLSSFTKGDTNGSLIVGYEYWWNGEFDARTTMTIGPSQSVQLSTDLCSPSNESPSIFHFRFVDELGHWSPVYSKNIDPACVGDFDEDGFHGTSDLLILLSQFGGTPPFSVDLNCDAIVNTADLLILLGNFGQICP